eukprot:28218_1
MGDSQTQIVEENKYDSEDVDIDNVNCIPSSSNGTPINSAASTWSNNNIINNVSPQQSTRKDVELIRQIVQFRMVLHKTKHMKMSYSEYSKYGNGMKKYDDDMNGPSNNIFFALLWVPSNKADGMKLQYFEELMASMRKSKYYVNQLNKECVYISGPDYGSHTSAAFDLKQLKRRCEELIKSDIENNTFDRIDIEMVVHQLAREEFDDAPKLSTTKKNEQAEEITLLNQEFDDPPKLSTKKKAQAVEMISLNQETENYAPRTASFAGYKSTQFEKQPMNPTTLLQEIKSKKTKLSKQEYVFAYVWFNMSKAPKNEETSTDINSGTLPALSILKKLHMQPIGDYNVFNVEIHGYDSCYKNLDLIVDRTPYWRQAVYVLVQCILLPIFILIPPIKIRKWLTDKTVAPRYRPVEGVKFDELDRTEQIPYDICALWKLNHRTFGLRFLSSVMALILISIIYIGPFLYTSQPEKEYDAKHLSFFDCFGPLFWYSLAIFTVGWWSCHSRVTVGPKEHMLLYYKLFIQRHIATDVYQPRTDWAVLTRLSLPKVLPTMLYAHRKGFLEFRTATDGLFSWNKFRCCKGSDSCKLFKSYTWYIVAIVIYFGVQNLENFEKYHQPFYVHESSKLYQLKMVYAIFSNVCSWMFLFCFILLWDTMFNRMARQHENIKNLSNLIIRNTYSEYIQFDWVDNILSWLSLEKIVKRKGTMLFASLETPLFTLFWLCLTSWSGTIYCIFGGVGLTLQNDVSFFSNSTLAVWFYLACLSVVNVCRMLWYGHKFEKESIQQQLAIKSQCGEMHANYLMQELKNDRLSKHERDALNTSQMLLSHVEHSEIVPKVFGIKCDKLTAKAGWTAAISVVPTIFAFVVRKII